MLADKLSEDGLKISRRSVERYMKEEDIRSYRPAYKPLLSAVTQCFLAGRSVAEMILGQKPGIFVGAFLPSPQRTGASCGSANPADGATR